MKKAAKITGYVLGVLLVLFLGAAVAAQSPAVQTFIGKRITEWLADSIDGDIVFEKIQLKPFNAVVLKDAVILDRRPYRSPVCEPVDTFAKAGYITATFSIRGLFFNEGLHVRKAAVTRGGLYLTVEPADSGSTSNLTRIFRTGPSGEASVEMGNLFDAQRVTVEDFRFRMVNYTALEKREKPRQGGIDWADIDVTASIKARHLSFRNGVLSGTADEVQAREKNGFTLTGLSGKAAAGNGSTLIEQLRIRDGLSDLSLPRFSMTYPKGKGGFSDFIRNVYMEAEIAPASVLDMGTLAYFAPALSANTFHGAVEGRVTGFVRDLDVERLSFADRTSGVEGEVRGRITGLPAAENMLLDFEAGPLSFDPSGLGIFLREWAPGLKADFSPYAPGVRFTLHAGGSGTLNGLQVDARIASGLGEGKAELTLSHLLNAEIPVAISGVVATEDLDIGQFIGSRAVRFLSAAASVEASLGKGGPAVYVDRLDILRLNALGYDYGDISASGYYAPDAFAGKVTGEDPHLKFTLEGGLSEGRYRVAADVEEADLEALQIDRRGVSKVAFRAEADFARPGGQVNIDSLRLENGEGVRRIGRIHLVSSADRPHLIRIASPFVSGFLRSRDFPSAIVPDLLAVTARKELPALFGAAAPLPADSFYELSLDFHDSRDLLAFVLPGLYIADSTAFRLKADAAGQLDARLQSSRIALRDKYLRHLDLRISNIDSALTVRLQSPEMKISGMSLRNSLLSARADDNRLQLSCRYDNDADYNGAVRLSASVAEGPLIRAVIDSAAVCYGGDRWQMHASEIRKFPGGWAVDRFIGYCEDQSIQVSGGFSKERADTLEMNLNRFNIGLLNTLLAGDFQLGGSASGKALIISPAGMLVNLTCDSTQIAGQRAGTLKMASAWNDRREAFELVMKNEIDGRKTLDVGGTLRPDTRAVDLTADFREFNIGFVSPALSSMFSEMGGGISGKVHAGGTLDQIELSSEDTRFENARLTIGFTQVPYTINGPFSLKNSGLHFEDIVLSDRYGGKGTVRGGILFDRFKDIRLNIGIDLDRMEALATTRADNSTLYGNVYASGHVSITGPVDDIHLDINAVTTKEGALHIPLGSTAAGSKNLLTFKEKEVQIDPYVEMMNSLQAEKKRGSNLSVNLKVNATPAVEAFVEIAGNVLNGKGSGAIDISVDNSGLFSLGGNYSLTDGNFHLSVLGLTSKDFSIEDGSSIRFNGDVMNSDLDIKGTYRTKTALNRLLADTSSTSTRRLVECGIGITDKLSNPQIHLSIEIPDLDPETRARVESALNTEDKIQKQFLSLLVSGSFIPNENSGIVNNTNVMFSSVTEIMASQLNYIFSRLDIPLDLGLTYQSTDSGYDMFDVALSTQLFNNRVIVNGTIGNKNYVRTNQSEVVGDIDIEVKVNKPGTLRLSAFSHSADEYTNYLDNSQRNGFGVSYQREFNTFTQFVKDLFTPRRKRRNAMPAESPTATFQVGADGKIRQEDGQQ